MYRWGKVGTVMTQLWYEVAIKLTKEQTLPIPVNNLPINNNK
jgi:hypothetical protein